MKQPVALLQQCLADGLALIASINHRLEITPQMGTLRSHPHRGNAVS
jgi:hypothetical protein